MTTYYDIILVAIPVALFGITALAYATGLGYITAVIIGGASSAGLTGHALFINAPIDPSPTQPQNQQTASGND